MAPTRQTTNKIVLTFAMVGFLVFGVFGSVGNANDDRAIAYLKAIQQKTASVVAKNLAACVAISDGVGAGSGVIVSEDGLVLTAGHVMTSDGEYEVTLPSGRTVRARPLGRNLNDDAGMVQLLEPGPWPFVQINRHQNLEIGEWVVSLGHSGGFEVGRTPPVRTGRILRKSPRRLVTDAVLIGGDSGGPLFNLKGELIGIHSSIGETVAENRHVTMDVFLQSWDQLKKGQRWGQLATLNESAGRSNRPENKTSPENQSSPEKKRSGLIGVRVDLEARDCRIKSVEPNSAASDAGMQPGDIVIHFDHVRIRDGQHLIDVVRRRHAGDTCPLLVRRNDKMIQFDIELR